MIETTFTISQDDFIEAQKPWCAREVKKLPGRLLLRNVSIVFGGFVGWSFHYLPVWVALSTATSLLALCLVTQWRKKALRRYQYARRIRIAETAHVRIDETGYHDDRPEMCKCWMAWGTFTGWIETSRVFIMGRDLTYITIPKASLSDEQQGELRALLNQKLGHSL